MTRRHDARDVRRQAARLAKGRPHPEHAANDDEARYASAHYAMSFTKGLDHDPDTGLVAETAAFEAFRAAIDGGFVAPFSCDVPVPTDATRIGARGRRRWEAPTAGFVFDLQGPDAQAVTMPPAPALGSDELAYEMAEVYELALLRDTPFAAFRDGEAAPDPALGASIGRLEAIAATPNAAFTRGRVVNAGGRIDAQTAFRGSTAGVADGPYVSQFLLIGNTRLPDGGVAPDPEAQLKAGRIAYGAQTIDQRVWTAPAGLDHMTDWASWLRVQNGGDVRDDAALFGVRAQAPRPRFIATPRDLATYVHDDALYQAYLNACLILLSMGAPLDPSFDALSGSAPIDCGCGGAPRPAQATGFALFGGPHILSLVTEVATRALKAVRYQKFNVHLRLRPEALAARVEKADAIGDRFGGDLQQNLMRLRDAIGQTVAAVVRRNSERGEPTALLPMAFQEGSPMHPAYGAGHATVAGACVTMLKAFFDAEAAFVRPAEGGAPVFRRPQAGDRAVAFEALPNGDALVEAPVARPLTLEGELNKLAANISIGRNMAGVHFYSDYYDSVRMGEEIAIGVLEEQALCYPNDAFALSLTTFDGDPVAIGRDGRRVPPKPSLAVV